MAANLKTPAADAGAGVSDYYTLATYAAEDSVGLLIATLRTRLFRALDLEFEKFGFTAAQWPILRSVADGQTPTAADLCRRLDYDTGSMTRMLTRLEQKGVIVRVPCTADRRVVQLRITATGRKVHRKLREAAIRVLNHLVHGFAPQEIHEFHQQLVRLHANLDAVYPNES